MRLPLLLGIVNVTPDSFSDGGSLATTQDAVAHGLKLLADGADILDIGGESTRPGAQEVSIDEEIARIEPVILELKRQNQDCVISIDTRKSAVAEAAILAGASIVNDVSALSFDPNIADVVARYGKSLVLGHTRGTPDVMRQAENCRYENLIEEVINFFKLKTTFATSRGVLADNIIYDPGLGFAKEMEQDCELLRHIKELKSLGRVMIGHSRKSFIGKVVDESDPHKREAGTIAASIYAMEQGAEYLRVHDAKGTKQALTMYAKLRRG